MQYNQCRCVVKLLRHAIHFLFCLSLSQTGGSKGYAFIEFDCDEVARIVAETMNNYLMGERLIKCKYCSHTNLLITSMIPALPGITRPDTHMGRREMI